MSASNDAQGGVVIGTAGHIDHGKTTLVRALTGIDTDRLAEEKKRGVSIELGFADLVLPNKRRIAIVDVPGHERFIKNMLAGATGLDAVLLVVAADEGIKPQTREHFEICRLLQVSRGVIVITKADLVGLERLHQLEQEIRDFCKNSFLESAPCVAVSANEGRGLTELLTEITSLVDRLEPRPSSSYARLPVDRSFKMDGFGTVVTGTLQGGSLRAGDTVEIHPLRQQYRIRGIQVHRTPVAEARVGQRTAVNLAGIEAQQIRRGSVLTIPNVFESTNIFDAVVHWLDPRHLKRVRQSLRLYVGCAESDADIRLIHTLEDCRTITRVSSHEPLLILPQDRFVLRTGEATVGGGSVIDAFPPIRINREKTASRLKILISADDSVRLRLLVEESTQGRKISNLVRITGWTPKKIKQLASEDETLTLCELEQRVICIAWLEQKRQQVVSWLESFHAANPSLTGVPMHQIRSSLMSGIEPSIGDFILHGIPAVVVRGDTVSLAGHAARLTPQENAIRQSIEKLFREAGLQPPSAEKAFETLQLQQKAAKAALEALLKEKRLLRVAPDLVLHADALNRIREMIAPRKGSRFSIPEFKEWTGVSRKYAIPLLEFLDRQHITRREGDFRIVV